jgi:hypothetical protein
MACIKASGARPGAWPRGRWAELRVLLLRELQRSEGRWWWVARRGAGPFHKRADGEVELEHAVRPGDVVTAHRRFWAARISREKGTMRGSGAAPDGSEGRGGACGERTCRGRLGRLGGRSPGARAPRARHWVGIQGGVVCGQQEEYKGMACGAMIIRGERSLVARWLGRRDSFWRMPSTGAHAKGERERDWELGMHRGHARRVGAQVGFYFVPSH